MIDIQELNRRMCEFALARRDAMGEEPGGLSNYYGRLAESGRMLRPEEIAVAQYIERTVPKDAPILEVCAGAAQLGHLLSLMGYRVWAVEIDSLRYNFAVALGAHIGSTCAVQLRSWQKLHLPVWRLLVTLNAVTSHIAPADSKRICDHALQGGDVIIRPRQFGAGIPVEIPGLKATPITEDVYHYAR